MKEKTTITKISSIPAWVEAEKRNGELCGQLAEVERRINGSLGEFAQLSQGPKAGDLDSKAAALLEGNAAPTSLWSVSQQEELSRARQERAVLIRAIEIHTATMNSLRGKLSRQVCAAVEPTYLEHVGKLKALVAEVGRLNDALHDLLLSIEQNGFSSSSLANQEFSSAGRLSDDYSHVNLFLKDCKARGF